MVIRSSEGKLKRDTPKKQRIKLFFPRYLLLLIHSLFVTIFIVIFIISVSKIRTLLTVESFFWIFATLVALTFMTWIWFHPQESTIFLNSDLSEREGSGTVTEEEKDKPQHKERQIIALCFVTENVLKHSEDTFTTSLRTLKVDLTNKGLFSTNYQADPHVHSLENFREQAKEEQAKLKILCLLDQGGKVIIPPLIGNIANLRVWRDLEAISTSIPTTFIVTIKKILVKNGLENYWGYWIFLELLWELKIAAKMFIRAI